VLKKPIEVPTKFGATNSHINGDVEEITITNPTPYPMESASKTTKCVVNGTIKRKIPLNMHPKIMGKRLPYLSDNRPNIGLNTIKGIICIPITMDTDKALRLATAIRY
jgi:hypothetical protein